MNTPFKRAFDLFEQNGQDFGETFEWYLLYGIARSQPDYFILARPCHRIAPQLVTDSGDSLFVAVFSGDILAAAAELPGVECITFQRSFRGSERFRSYLLKNLAAKYYGLSRSSRS